MLKALSGFIKRIFTITDVLSGVCFFSMMALVLINIILRNIFRLPILGTVEIVGLLAVTGLGLALANCEMADGNIAMDVVTEKLSQRKQKVIEIAVYIISLGFWAIVVWRIFAFASTSFINGRVTATVSIPLYPFIFILGFNVFCLCVVLLYKLLTNVKEVAEESRKSVSEGKEESK